MRTLFASALFLVLLVACEGDQTVKYKWTRLDVTNLDNTSRYPAPTGLDSISKSVYGIRLYLFPVETYRKGRYFDEYESIVINENPVDTISISSTQDLYLANDTFIAGEPINSLFYHFNNTYSTSAQMSFYGLPANAYYYDNYKDVPYPEYVDLLLMFPPINSIEQRFRIYMRMDDGQVYVDTTESIKLF